MPTIYYRIEAPGVNILKTVSDEVIFGLLDELDLIRYFKNAVYTTSSFQAVSNYSDGDGRLTLVRDRCDVHVDFILDKSQVQWPDDSPYTTTAYGVRADHKGRHTSILVDEKASVLVEHHTVACGLNLSFNLTFETFDVACKAFDTIKNKYTGGLIKTPFDISFSYPVSTGLAGFLYAVYKAKTDYTDKTFLQYLADMGKTEISFDVRKVQLADTEPDRELLIRNQQKGCVGQLSMDQKEPEAHYVEQLPTGYSISFEFAFQFGRPNLVAVNTPVSVDNTVLPYGLFENTMINAHYNPWVGGVYEDVLISEYIQRSRGNYNWVNPIVRMPSYDDWFATDREYRYYGYKPVIVAHFTLDGPTTTFNIAQINDVVLHPVVQSIMKEVGNDIFNYDGLFNVGVWASDLRLGSNLVSIDSDLNLTITSNRMDKVYHLVISETTNLQNLSNSWNDLLIKYRYFFPMTIERNLKTLIDKKYFYISYDNTFISLIDSLLRTGRLKSTLAAMVTLGEDTNEIYAYTQNAAQLADYLALTQSKRTGYTLPTGTDATSLEIIQYYTTYTSVEGRSLMVAFLEQCLIVGYTSLSLLPSQYIEPSRKTYPYAHPEGGYYGFNTPFRVLNYNIRPKQRTE